MTRAARKRSRDGGLLLREQVTGSSCEHGIAFGDECTECTMDIETVAAAARAARDWAKPIDPKGRKVAEEYGYVKLSRKLFELDPFWLEPRVFSKLEAWVDLIQMAAWRDHRRMVKGIMVELQRGQLLISIRFLSDRWKWSKDRVQGFISQLEVMERIKGHRSGQAGTVYSLVNYERYQGGPDVDQDTEQDASRTPAGHLSGHLPDTYQDKENTGNKGNTVNKKKKSIGAGKKSKLWKIVPADWQPTDRHRELAAELRVDVEYQAALFRDHEFKVPKSDADRAFANWLRNAVSFNPPKRTIPKVNEMPKSNAPRTGRPVRTDGHDPEAEKLQREREEDAAVQSWAAAHPDDSKSIIDAITEEMRTDLRWRGTPAGIVQGVARGLYRTKVLERIGQNGAAAIA